MPSSLPSQKGPPIAPSWSWQTPWASQINCYFPSNSKRETKIKISEKTGQTLVDTGAILCMYLKPHLEPADEILEKRRGWLENSSQGQHPHLSGYPTDVKCPTVLSFPNLGHWLLILGGFTTGRNIYSSSRLKIVRHSKAFNNMIRNLATLEANTQSLVGSFYQPCPLS